MTENDSQIPDNPKEVLRTTLEAADEPDEEMFTLMLAEEVEVMQERFPDTLDPEAIWHDLQAERHAFPDLEHNITDVWQAGEMVFARYTSSGTFEGELRLGEGAVFEPTGQEMEMPGIIIARVEDGQITGWAYHAELLPTLQELGIIPPFSELAE